MPSIGRGTAKRAKRRERKRGAAVAGDAPQRNPGRLREDARNAMWTLALLPFARKRKSASKTLRADVSLLFAKPFAPTTYARGARPHTASFASKTPLRRAKLAAAELATGPRQPSAPKRGGNPSLYAIGWPIFYQNPAGRRAHLTGQTGDDRRPPDARGSSRPACRELSGSPVWCARQLTPVRRRTGPKVAEVGHLYLHTDGTTAAR